MPSDGKSSHCLWQGELIRRSKVFASFEFRDYFHSNTSTFCQNSENNQLYGIKFQRSALRAVEGGLHKIGTFYWKSWWKMAKFKLS